MEHPRGPHYSMELLVTALRQLHLLVTEEILHTCMDLNLIGLHRWLPVLTEETKFRVCQVQTGTAVMSSVT